MGIFDWGKTEQIKYLDDERSKTWDRLVKLESFVKELQNEIRKKASDSEKEAANSSKKAAEYKNKSELRLEEAKDIVNKINSEYSSSVQTKDNILDIKISIDNLRDEITATFNSLVEIASEYKEKINLVDSKLSEFENFYSKYPDIDENLEEISDFIKKVEENVEKSNVSLIALNKRKKEIDDIYREIFGYQQTDEDNETTKVEGLKDELEKSYQKISLDIKETFDKINQINSSYESKYTDFENGHKSKYEKINKEIDSLLPRALTAGLSAAFSSKRQDEIQESQNLQDNFTKGIYILIGVSLLPVAVSIWSLFKGISLEEVILRLPRLVLAIVPMYVPALWFTYSASKKLNLSKRLIEEYTHKEVLSKTYEGLSNQIASIVDKEQSEELKFRLLSSFLQISSENPGKLISNYNSSDHPIMEALEQSYKFQIAIDKLEGIPGMGKIAAMFESQSKKNIDAKAAKIEDGFESKKKEEETSIDGEDT
ncbi:hypothetical protein EXU85_14610 [Spirosoma sp. KCTC 42546]|uniref:hypothetical protein n=1 Tax=Spirosoma sp. KCTC 42546 TaxID=2520506 RepID=UPI0011570D7F|nr:hypothetical protein [Spirosoma sp. KCTC 42546]QDK79774.1 hypothetical protein EXU85_14610 [Spirosoma sp. KCTC 42546]